MNNRDRWEKLGSFSAQRYLTEVCKTMTGLDRVNGRKLDLVREYAFKTRHKEKKIQQEY